jgi:predicted amidohydrolase YtcJ
VTHEYTILTGGIVLPGGHEPSCSAIAWAGDTILALGGDDEVRAISRGDSHFHELHGEVVVPLGAEGVDWPPVGRLEVGGPADLAVLSADPRSPARGGPPPRLVAVIRAGRVTDGGLPPR